METIVASYYNSSNPYDLLNKSNISIIRLYLSQGKHKDVKWSKLKGVPQKSLSNFR